MFFFTKSFRVLHDLTNKHHIVKGQNNSRVWTPGYPTRGKLLTIHSPFHLLMLNYALYITKIIELPACCLPASISRVLLLNPMLRATQGTIEGTAMALTKGYAVNLGGGLHHADAKGGGGFCCYADITLAIREARVFGKIKKAMIIDLDAHQGNGHERDFLEDDDCYIIDFYNAGIFPGDSYAAKVGLNFRLILIIFRGLMMTFT